MLVPQFTAIVSFATCRGPWFLRELHTTQLPERSKRLTHEILLRILDQLVLLARRQVCPRVTQPTVDRWLVVPSICSPDWSRHPACPVRPFTILHTYSES